MMALTPGLLLVVVLVGGCRGERELALMDLPTVGARARALDALIVQTALTGGYGGAIFWPDEPDSALRMRYLLSAPFFERWDSWQRALGLDLDPAIQSLALAMTCGSPAPGAPESIEDRAAACGESGFDCERVQKCLPEFGAEAIRLVRPWLRSVVPGVGQRAHDVLCAIVERAVELGPYSAQAFEIWLSTPTPDRACRWALEKATGLSLLHDLVIEEGAP